MPEANHRPLGLDSSCPILFTISPRAKPSGLLHGVAPLSPKLPNLFHGDFLSRMARSNSADKGCSVAALRPGRSSHVAIYQVSKLKDARHAGLGGFP